MKKLNYLFCLLVVITFTSCGNNTDRESSEGQETTSATTETSNQGKEGSLDQTAQSNGIIGKWKLTLDAFDQNENQELEADERQKGVSNNYLLQLNADGTCRMQNIFTGSYTVKNENGKRVLTIQRKRIESEEDEDPLPDVYHIKSVSKDELILQVIDAAGPSTFWIFKRV